MFAGWDLQDTALVYMLLSGIMYVRYGSCMTFTAADIL